MGMTDQVIRKAPQDDDRCDAQLRRIRELIAESRERDSEDVLNDIARVLGSRLRPADIYQKPLG
jgi:hypothetical protein